MAAGKILIVEDESPVRELLAATLMGAGYVVEQAADGHQARDMVSGADLPDLVLLDWMMPGMSGLEFAKWLKRDDRLAEIPIIMLTARSEETDRIVGLELGGTSAKDLKREAEAKVADLIPSGDSLVDKSLSFAEARISQSLRSVYWLNANALRSNGAAVFTHEWNAANALDPIAAGEGSTAIGAGAAESKLVAADYLLARYELERAIAAFGNPAKIAEAQDAFARGEAAMAAGDYLAGPNHTLPTGGTARFFSPLGTEDFVKKSSLISFSKQGLARLGKSIIEIAELEGLEAHAKSVAIRLDN